MNDSWANSIVKISKACYTYAMNMKHDRTKFTTQLLTWYDENKRCLPWRDQPYPYYVWVSEIMLQQTRVEAVKPYFERFIKALPTLSDLAQCEDEVLAKLWEGLGYYTRVRNMKKCAIECMERFDGELPSNYEDLLHLSGIGAYTAGAIASIAYKQKVPAVDGNVLRVFSRVLLSYDDILKESTKKKFQEIIQAYIPDRCDAFNQALMELGALICVPNAAPRCNICPIASECLGYQSGKAALLPIKKAKKKRRIEKKTILILLHRQSVHLNQRENTGLLANLYQFDMLEEHWKKTEVLEYAKTLGDVAKLLPLPNAKHIFSHIEWHMKGWMIVFDERNIAGIWASLADLQGIYAIPTAFKVYREACEQYLKGEQL